MAEVGMFTKRELQDIRDLAHYWASEDRRDPTWTNAFSQLEASAHALVVLMESVEGYSTATGPAPL
jgi:hypothetical protein